MADDMEDIAKIISRVCPERILPVLGLPAQLQWDGRRSWYTWTPEQQHLADTMAAPMLEIASNAAVRIVGEPKPDGARSSRYLREYIRRVVAVRDKFARRAWALLSPMAG